MCIVNGWIPKTQNLNFFLKSYYLCVCVPWCAGRDQRTTLRNWFSPFTFPWAPGIKLKLLGLRTACVLERPSYQVYHTDLNLCLGNTSQSSVQWRGTCVSGELADWGGKYTKTYCISSSLPKMWRHAITPQISKKTTVQITDCMPWVYRLTKCSSRTPAKLVLTFPSEKKLADILLTA